MDCAPILHELPLFRSLTPDQLRLVADLAEEHSVPAGGVLSQQADAGANLFIIGEGEAVIHRVDEQGLRRPVGMLSAGAAYGVTALFLPDPRDATVTAASPLRVWTIRREPFQQLLRERPGLARRLNIPDEIAHKLRAPALKWLEPGESMALFTRRHPFAFWQRALRAAFLAGVLVALLEALPTLAGLPLGLTTLQSVVIGLLVLALLWIWLDWRNDYVAVTTRRIAHHERVALLYESRYEAPLERVQNINIRRNLWGSVLDYGELSVETAARIGLLRFSQTPHPEAVRDAVFAQLDRLRATQRAAERRQIRKDITSRLEESPAVDGPAPDDLEQPVERPEEAPATYTRSGRLLEALEWMARKGIFPATRMVVDGDVVWRKHWIFLVRGTLGPGLFAIACAGLAILGVLGVPAEAVALVPRYPWIMAALALFGLGWLWWEYSDWSNDQYIVSDERIVDVEKRPLMFSEHRREATLGVIQNVSSATPSFLAAVLNYGDVIVQTAGSGEFTFNHVPNPGEVQREIFRRMEAYRERERREEAERRRREFAEWLAIYDQVRRDDSPAGSESPPPAD